MRTRSLGLTLFTGLALFVAACSSGASSPSVAAPESEAPASAAPASEAPSSEAPSSEAPSSPAASFTPMKIGVVTDVGTVNDKNFNEYTFVGAKDGAAAIGSEEPVVVVPKDASEYPTLIKNLVDQGYEIIVTAGFNLGVETTKAAHDNPDIWFIGVDQGPPCVTPEGLPDTDFKCEGDAATLLPKYVAISYQEDQAGYLAGMVAASVSQTGKLGAIGGITLCGPCIRYIQGFELGAKAINPDATVTTAWVTESDFVKAFNDPVTGKNFGQQFIAQNKPDVLFQVAGKTGNGILDAACEAGILGVGVDVDQALSYPNAAKCTVTSAEKKLALAVAEDIKAIASGAGKGGDDHWDAARDGVGYSPFHDLESTVPADLVPKLDAAFAEMQAGTLKTCPSKADGDPVDCGQLK